MKKRQVKQAVRKIKKAVQSGNVSFPKFVEEKKIFPLSLGTRDKSKPYEFVHANIVAAWGPNKRNNGGFVLAWGAKNVGFGELTFRIKGGKKSKMWGDIEGGKVVCETETMSRRFVKEALAYLAEQIELED